MNALQTAQTALRAAAYARFSSEMQRDESIAAQLRAIRAYCEKNGLLLVHEYIDRAHSATNDQRPEFQQMIGDAKRGNFDLVIVHKLDRFSRNRYDSVIYRRQLKNAGVELRSVLENLDGSPESILLESLLDGLNEFYARNLAREVQKGKKENALRAKHVGGLPPLGYRVNPETMLLEIEPFEAQAVQLLFQMYLDGKGYTAILNELNRRGYRTKRGQPFGKNSLYEILRNEKYMGTYTYNRTVSKSVSGKTNRHRLKPDDEIIRIPNAIPALISPQDFAAVQKKMNERRHKTARFKAKHVYLLSGKIICGVCGSPYAGNARKARPDHPLYCSYRCTRRNAKTACRNTEIRAQTLENHVLSLLANQVFDETLLPELYRRYADFAAQKDEEGHRTLCTLSARLDLVQSGFRNIVAVVVETGSAALNEKLRELEMQKAALEFEIRKIQEQQRDNLPDYETLCAAFRKAKQLLQTGELRCAQKVIDQYIEQVTLFPDRIQVEFRLGSFHQCVSTQKELLP